MSGAEGKAADGGDVSPEDEHANGLEGGAEPTPASGEGAETAEGFDLVAALGASKELSPQVLRLYIPNKDRHSREFGCQRKWVLEAANLLAKIGGGVTMLPAAEGGWYDPENDTIVWENPILVYTYVKPDLFEQHLPELRRFLHRLGRETDQGEVALEFDGDFYRINQYDPNEEI
jgi:hypothetical protein